MYFFASVVEGNKINSADQFAKATLVIEISREIRGTT
jgi:hypothetical protein